MRGRPGQSQIGRKVPLRVQEGLVERPEARVSLEPRVSEDTGKVEEPPRVIRAAERATAGQQEAAVRELRGLGHGHAVDSWVWATLPPARRPVVGGPQRCWRAWQEIV